MYSDSRDEHRYRKPGAWLLETQLAGNGAAVVLDVPMKGWQQDLLDHLVWLTVLSSAGHERVEDVVAELKDQLPCLRSTVTPWEPSEPSHSWT